MDWSKAKTILIIAFIITNGFLIYHIQKDTMNGTLDNRIPEVVSILEGKNILVNTDIPAQTVELPALEVEYVTYEKEEIEKLFEKELGDPINSKNIELSIEGNDKIIVYKNSKYNPYIEELDGKRAQQEAERFLKKYGFMTPDALYWSSLEQERGFKVTFRQKYKGKFLEHSYMTLLVTKSGVKEFERIWLKPLKFGTNKQGVIPASKALLKFMNEWNGNQKVSIVDISLVYWLDSSQNTLTQWENIESGTAIPAWRLELDNGEVRFITGFENY